MTKVEAAFRDYFAKVPQNGEFNNFISLQHIDYINLKLYKYLKSLPNDLGKASMKRDGLAQCHSDVRAIVVTFP